MLVTKLSGKATNFGIKTVDLADASISFPYYVINTVVVKIQNALSSAKTKK